MSNRKYHVRYDCTLPARSFSTCGSDSKLGVPERANCDAGLNGLIADRISLKAVCATLATAEVACELICLVS